VDEALVRIAALYRIDEDADPRQGSRRSAPRGPSAGAVSAPDRRTTSPAQAQPALYLAEVRSLKVPANMLRRQREGFRLFLGDGCIEQWSSNLVEDADQKSGHEPSVGALLRRP